MEKFTLKITGIQTLNEIREVLENNQRLNETQINVLTNFLDELPEADDLMSKKIPTDAPIEIALWNTKDVVDLLAKWKKLFNNLPGFLYCPFCYVVDKERLDLMRKNILIVAAFAPSLIYNSMSENAYEVHLKDDGTAKFWFPTFEDAEQYPELYNFKGSWKEAYLLLIEILKKGWPMEEFPEELQKFLPKH